MASTTATLQLVTVLIGLVLLLGSQQVQAGEGFRIFLKRTGGPAGNRRLHGTKSTTQQSVTVRRGAAIFSKVTNCPGIKTTDISKLVAKAVVKARIGAIPKAPTREAARFAGQTITMYIAPQPLDAKKGQEVLGPIASSLTKLPYCPFEGDRVLNLEVTLISIQPVAKRTYTATDKKILKCLNKIKVSMRAGHIEKIKADKAAKTGPLVVPYVLAA